MPQSDSVEDFIAQRGLFVPFSKELFTDQPCIQSRSLTSTINLNDIESEDFLLPAVCTTASAMWVGRENDRAPVETCARRDKCTGEPAADSNPSAAAKRSESRRAKRRQLLDDISSITAGRECYINSAAWTEYLDEWLYPSPLEKTFVKGIYGELVRGTGRKLKRHIDIPVFKFSYEVDNDWIETWGVQFQLPDDCKLSNISTYSPYTCM